jgi:hypothetical protein
VFETARDCALVKDVNLKCTRVNLATLCLLGLSSDRIIGKKHAELFGFEMLKDLGNLELCVMLGQGLVSE